MSFEENRPGESKSRVLLIAVGVVVVLIGALAASLWLLRAPAAPAGPPQAQTAAPAAAPAAPPLAPPDVTPPASSDVAPASAAVTAPRSVRKPKPAPKAAPAPALALKVDSDVPGASVFVDRAYLGTTPLTTSDVAPGSHVVQVSAPGYENQSNTVDVTSGTTSVMVRFKVVRLNESIPVLHKHTIGSCEGRLIADLQGFRYDTRNSDHAFSIPFADVRAFEVDYLKKNLRVTRKDGKAFNFTDRNANADALFVFHKKVEAARVKIAAGFAPDK